MKVEKTNLKAQLSFTLCCDSRGLSVFVMKPGYNGELDTWGEGSEPWTNQEEQCREERPTQHTFHTKKHNRHCEENMPSRTHKNVIV